MKSRLASRQRQTSWSTRNLQRCQSSAFHSRFHSPRSARGTICDASDTAHWESTTENGGLGPILTSLSLNSEFWGASAQQRISLLRLDNTWLPPRVMR